MSASGGRAASAHNPEECNFLTHGYCSVINCSAHPPGGKHRRPAHGPWDAMGCCARCKVKWEERHGKVCEE